MFVHEFKYRLKCFLRDKVIIFWTAVFPILLSTLFFMAFSNLAKADNFGGAKVAVVDNEAYRNNDLFRKALASVSETGVNQVPLLIVEEVSREEADSLLEKGKVDGIIFLDDDIKLIVKKSGFYQSIIKSFLDRYKQASASYASLLEMNPELFMREGLLKDYLSDHEYLAERKPGKSETDNSVTYFYALLAMASLYGSFWGNRVVYEIQADQSFRGLRVNTAPVNKMITLLAGMLAAWIIQFAELLILILYMRYVLKVSFGSQTGYILLTCLAGALTGIAQGALVSGLVKRNEGLKIGVLISLSMIMSGLSGLYYAPLKYMVTRAVPVLAYINPANLITDALYALYYYETYQRFALNILLLLGFATIYLVLTCFCVRRERYASIPGIHEDN